jgi:Zn-dependent protease
VLESFRIGSVFGIAVRLHWLFLPVVLWVWMMMARDSIAAGLAITVGLFGSVFLHELGHSLVAQRFGIKVIDITLWPLGGLARMSHIPESPRTEGLIAIAGPAVNFVIAAVLFPLLPSSDPDVIAGMMRDGTWTVAHAITLSLLAINLMLGVFNLVPAFPMDGGRILRALLGLRLPWLRATEVAVKVGRVLAVCMLVYGALTMNCALFLIAGFVFFSCMPAKNTKPAIKNCALFLIAGFVFFAGMQELLVVRLRHARETFGQGFGFEPGAAPGPTPGEPDGGPVWNRGPSALSSGGFSDEDVERLERYRGRLGGKQAQDDEES